MSELDDRIADSQRVTNYLRSLQGGTPPVDPPIDPPVKPPVQPPAVTGPVSFQGDLVFNGMRFDTSGITGNTIASFRIVIPAPLPDGWSGNSSQISVFENGNGMAWKHVVLSQTMGDMAGAAPYAAGGNGGANVWIGFNSGQDTAVPVTAGQVWYLNVKNEFWTPFNEPPYKPSIGPDSNGNFGVKLYPV